MGKFCAQLILHFSAKALKHTSESPGTYSTRICGIISPYHHRSLNQFPFTPLKKPVAAFTALSTGAPQKDFAAGHEDRNLLRVRGKEQPQPSEESNYSEIGTCKEVLQAGNCWNQ